jgi:hypothetical protein
MLCTRTEHVSSVVRTYCQHFALFPGVPTSNPRQERIILVISLYFVDFLPLMEFTKVIYIAKIISVSTTKCM